MDFIEFSSKTVEDALTEASISLGIPSNELEYEVIEKGSTGFLGIGSKNAVIKVRKKFSVEENVKEFKNHMEAFFGVDSCYVLHIRPIGGKKIV